MIDPIVRDAESKMFKSVEHFAGDLATIRTGRANPALIDKIIVTVFSACAHIDDDLPVVLRKPTGGNPGL